MDPDSPFDRTSVLRALRETRPAPFWLDNPAAPAARPSLTGAESCDLAVVGAGFSGLWAALLAKEQDPTADVVVLEAGAVGGQASGRNGGICMASLTHGFSQGEELFPAENARLNKLGDENLAAIERAVKELPIDCGWELTGEMEVATTPWQVDGLRERRDQSEAFGLPGTWLEGDELRAEIHSPTYLAGFWHHDSAILDPARLAWGLARACEERGVRIYEGTSVTALERAGGGVELRAPWGAVRAQRAVLATNAFPASAPPAPPVRGAGVRLRADDGAAQRGAARRRSAGRAGRRWRMPATCSTTTGSPRTSASSGAGGTRCTTAAVASARSTRTGQTCSPSWPVTSSARSPSSRA